jgi:hypothetical protein
MEETRISCTQDLNLYTRTFTLSHSDTNVFSFAFSIISKPQRLADLLWHIYVQNTEVKVVQ